MHQRQMTARSSAVNDVRSRPTQAVCTSSCEPRSLRSMLRANRVTAVATTNAEKRAARLRLLVDDLHANIDLANGKSRIRYIAVAKEIAELLKAEHVERTRAEDDRVRKGRNGPQ